MCVCVFQFEEEFDIIQLPHSQGDSKQIKWHECGIYIPKN